MPNLAYAQPPHTRKSMHSRIDMSTCKGRLDWNTMGTLFLGLGVLSSCVARLKEASRRTEEVSIACRGP